MLYGLALIKGTFSIWAQDRYEMYLIIFIVKFNYGIRVALTITKTQQNAATMKAQRSQQF